MLKAFPSLSLSRLLQYKVIKGIGKSTERCNRFLINLVLFYSRSPQIQSNLLLRDVNKIINCADLEFREGCFSLKKRKEDLSEYAKQSLCE